MRPPAKSMLTLASQGSLLLGSMANRGERSALRKASIREPVTRVSMRSSSRSRSNLARRARHASVTRVPERSSFCRLRCPARRATPALPTRVFASPSAWRFVSLTR